MKKNGQRFFKVQRTGLRKEYFWIFFLFFSFFLIFFMVSSITYWKANQNTRKVLETEIAQALNKAESEWEKSTQKIYEAGYNMLNNEALSYLLPSAAQEQDPLKSSGLINWMKIYAGGTSQYSGENFLYYDDRHVITDEGMEDFSLYFSVLHPHARYAQADWEDLLQSAPHYKTLHMDTVQEKYSGRQEQTVLPVVLSKNIHNRKVVLVTEIQADRVQAMFESCKTLENQSFLCMDQNRNVFFSTGGREPEPQEKEALARMLELSPMTMQEMEYGRKGYLVAGKKGALGLDYFMFTPLDQMHRVAFARNQFMLLFFLLTMVLFFILTLIYTRRIYHPLRNVVQKLSQMQAEPEHTGRNFQEELDQLCASSTALLTRQRNLIYKSFNESVRSMLRGSAMRDDSMCLEYLSRIGVDPQNLTCMMIQLEFCGDYYCDFSEEERRLVEDNLPNIMAQLLGTAGFNVVQDDLSSRCICFFSNEKHLQEKLVDSLKYIRMLLSNDEDYCRVETGMACGCCNSGEDVRRLLLQAATALRSQPKSGSGLPVYEEEHTRFHLLFTQRERNQIINLLTAGEEEALFELVDGILEKNRSANVHEGLIQLLYRELYQIGYEYLMIYGNGKPDKAEQIWRAVLETKHAVPTHDQTETVKEIYKNCILLTRETQNADDTLEAILTYVREHFAENIYVETVGDAMGFHPKYLSRIFKERTGVNMSEYITLLRITKAKDLLENTEKSVGEISEEVGFENRTTFFRSFKKLESVSPNEYRKISRQMKR